MKINNYKVIIAPCDNYEGLVILTTATSVNSAENSAMEFFGCPRSALTVIKLN